MMSAWVATSILKGIVINPEGSIAVQIMSGHSVMKGDEDRVYIEIRSGTTIHASAEVVLATSYPGVTGNHTESISGNYPFNNKEYYTNAQLFHGPALQCIEFISACSDKGIVGQTKAAPSPSEWMTQPMRSSWLADPMILDASFQMMILWSFQRSNTASLPTRIGSYRQYQRHAPT